MDRIDRGARPTDRVIDVDDGQDAGARLGTGHGA
jgi:hypothetical protein